MILPGTPNMDCVRYLLGHNLPSPCFVIDEDVLQANAALLARVQNRTGARILLALKAYSAWKTFPLLSRAYHGELWGICASSIDEAILGREKFGGLVSVFAPAWTDEEMRELARIADHVIFNSLAQFQKFRPLIEAVNKKERKNSPLETGLRINPEHSEGALAIYNPCSPSSRLGARRKDITEEKTRNFDGIHFHTLCEQDAGALARTLRVMGEKFTGILNGRKWLNFGGGHHITRADYDLDLLCHCLCEWRDKYGTQIYLEPGEAVALNAGWLLATVLDIVEADYPVAILDVSAACHTPDVLEMPYRPEIYYMEETGICLRAKQEGAFKFRIGGKSCLAGDDFGVYAFECPLRIGQKLAFSDMAIYSMVKTNTFNGLRLPSIGIFSSQEHPEFKLIKTFGHEDFRGRLS